MNWSTDGQAPEFLAATRMVSLGDDVVGDILARLKLAPGMSVLDVGSGSGEYCFRLGSATRGVQFTGIEIDPAFVEHANRRITGDIGYPFEEPNSENSYRFVCGNGLQLPFEDGEFDAVISHTYLTAVPDWACALAEMCRVCKPGGIVSSVTSMTDDFYGTGSFDLFTTLFDPASADLLKAVANAKARLAAPMNLTSGIRPRKVPVSFDWMGLRDVTCAPLAHYFCLSDAATSVQERKRYVDLLYLMETNQLQRLKACPATRDMLADEQWDAYADLLQVRRAALSECNENHEWDWYGNTSLLVCGTVPDNAPSGRWHAFRNASTEAARVLQTCIDETLVRNADTSQLGPGRCIKVVLSRNDGSKLTVCGFDPPRALLEACGVTLGNAEADYQRIESQFRTETRALEDLPDLPNETVYGIDDMWEAVSEASMAGVSVQFKDAGALDGCRIVACIAVDRDYAGKSASAHPDVREAVMRAFARAYAALSCSRPPFLLVAKRAFL